MASINYTTVEGDRLDLLAAKYYGGNRGIQIIIDANPTVQITTVFPMGTVLILPIVEDSTLTENTELPPWKR